MTRKETGRRDSGPFWVKLPQQRWQRRRLSCARAARLGAGRLRCLFLPLCVTDPPLAACQPCRPPETVHDRTVEKEAGYSRLVECENQLDSAVLFFFRAVHTTLPDPASQLLAGQSLAIFFCASKRDRHRSSIRGGPTDTGRAQKI